MSASAVKTIETETVKTIETETAKLNLGEDTDDNDDPFASDVEVDLEEDLEEDEAVIDNE